MHGTATWKPEKGRANSDNAESDRKSPTKQGTRQADT